MSLHERMKKYAGRLYTHEETEMLSDLQATMRALEVAREKLKFYANHKASMYDTGEQAKSGLKIIDEILKGGEA